MKGMVLGRKAAGPCSRAPIKASARAQGITINGTPEPAATRLGPSPQRHNQDAPPKPEFLSEMSVRSGAPSCCTSLVLE